MVLPPWHPHPDIWLVLGGVWAAYLVTVRRHRGRVRADDARERRRTWFFSLGMLTLWIASDWPIHDLAEDYLFGAHMVQHMLHMLVAPPLLIAGTPPWLLRTILGGGRIRAVFRLFTRPVAALIVFNAVLLFIHWPAIVAAQVDSEFAHLGIHVLTVAASLVMWWPVMSPLPELPPLSPPGQMMYLFFQSLAPTIPASFLTFGSTILYPAYAADPRIWGVSAHSDQLIAGLIMKILGGLLLWGFITAIFFRWHAREERDGWDALQLQQVERQVRSELTKG
ncbi:MAG: cytochrome c oxidase assembly protein [Candidatus Velamenicoccus archaeovorus]